jgi:CRISPR-associated endoribonuclease Cas6
MPLRKLNRLIALNALKNFDITKNLPLNTIFELNEKKNKININDLGYLIGPILNAGGRLGKSQYATELLSSNNDQVIKDRSTYLIKLNNKRKEIETLVLNEINFQKIEEENKEVIIYYNPNINEGLIGIIAARLKDYFNKPSIVITATNELLKGSARSIYDYNIGRVIKNSLDKKIIIGGGGHNMAAGFTLNKENLKNFKNYILDDFVKSNTLNSNIFLYESEISPLAFGRPQNDSILFAQPTFFTICSAWPELMNSIGEGLVRSKELYIGSQNFRVAAVNIVMPPDFKEKMTWIPRMNSSFVVSETLRGEKKKKYIMPDDPKCVELMKNNLIHKWKRLCEIRGDIAASWTDTPAEKCSNLFSSEDIELNFVGVHKTKMHLIKTVPVQSFRNVEISMKAPLPLQRLAWSSGLGEMNSMCYGVVEPKEV